MHTDTHEIIKLYYIFNNHVIFLMYYIPARAKFADKLQQ